MWHVFHAVNSGQIRSVSLNVPFCREPKLRLENGAEAVLCVDLGENFPTSIYLQKSASIQRRTSLVKFARSPRTDPPGLRRVLRPIALLLHAVPRGGRASGDMPRRPALVPRPRSREPPVPNRPLARTPTYDICIPKSGQFRYRHLVFNLSPSPNSSFVYVLTFVFR